MSRVNDREVEYVKAPPRAWWHPQDQCPPRVKAGPPPQGEDFYSLTAKHGRPYGVFEHGRQIPYRGGS